MKKAFAASPILRACPVDPKDRTGVPRVVRFALCALRHALHACAKFLDFNNPLSYYVKSDIKEPFTRRP